MTGQRASKRAIREAMKPGEAYNAAALRLRNTPTAEPLQRTITVYAHGAAFPPKQHALIDNPEARARMGIGNLVLQGRALCGSRGGSPESGGWRLLTAPGEGWEPHSGVDFAPEDSGYCQECVIAWRERFQPDDTESKYCAGCSRDLPTNKFRAHKGRKGGLATECEECRRAAKKTAENARETEAMDEMRQKRRRIAEGWLVQVEGWQESAHLKPFQCHSGHVLSPEITERRHDVILSWRCQCGATEISRAEFTLVNAMSVIQGARPDSPLTVGIA